MPILIPREPSFAHDSERVVWQRLADQLGDNDLLIANQRLATSKRDFEIDLIAVVEGRGAAVIEVKSQKIHSEEGRLYASYGSERKDVIEQVTAAKYALGEWLRQNTSFTKLNAITHLIVLPYHSVSADLTVPSIRRDQIAGRDDMPELGEFVRAALAAHMSASAGDPINGGDLLRLKTAFSGRSMPQQDLIAGALERHDVVERLSQQQATILSVIRTLPRVLIKGGAGSGKTWLALELARRLTEDGKRVALLCYSRGLGLWLRRRVATFKPSQRPAYVGTFHGMGVRWGAPVGADRNDTSDSDFWEVELPEKMRQLASELDPAQRFDAIVIDEAQDFADNWWGAIDAALVDSETGGLYVLSDEGQQVFSRFGSIPGDLVPIVLEHNLRNTRQITEAFNALAPIRMKLGDHEGPAVRFIQCAPTDAIENADDTVDALLEEGFRPEDIAVLCTGRRHPEQRSRQELEGETGYWESFWDDEQVFYGHVLGFKGLERMVVVLVLNDEHDHARAKEKLYVGLSRARELLVVCGDADYIEEVGGPAVRRRITG